MLFVPPKEIGNPSPILLQSPSLRRRTARAESHCAECCSARQPICDALPAMIARTHPASLVHGCSGRGALGHRADHRLLSERAVAGGCPFAPYRARSHAGDPARKAGDPAGDRTCRGRAAAVRHSGAGRLARPYRSLCACDTRRADRHRQCLDPGGDSIFNLFAILLLLPMTGRCINWFPGRSTPMRPTRSLIVAVGRAAFATVPLLRAA